MLGRRSRAGRLERGMRPAQTASRWRRKSTPGRGEPDQPTGLRYIVGDRITGDRVRESRAVPGPLLRHVRTRVRSSQTGTPPPWRFTASGTCTTPSGHTSH
jgi:hypothetical protein